MASSQTNENTTPGKTCRCGEGDKNIWTAKTSENSEQSQKCPNCQIIKSGPLFLSSKGIGWTSWKKRWFVLTRTSLIFYRSDPNCPPQKGGEANPTLGGIDLNSSGSVVVKADKKLLTVLFPDGRDGRAFTLKAETSEELNEWKAALENALAQAPSATLVMGQNGIFHNEIADSVEASLEQLGKDRQPMTSLVVGRPVLLALEDIDGSPSFLEKALRFIEEYGIKVEGILRQSADVEEVERRVQEYEQGKVEFSSDEDAHVIGDCIKHVLREMPSSPVPASCCTALVDAYRADRGNRVNAIRTAISETFPEPNRRLVQRILKMMRTVAAHRSENRMSLSALAACMAPLLLRPLLAGDCEFEDDFNMGGDGSIQLLKAAAAANHAQAIVMILLEEYERIFDEELLQDCSLSSEIYTESEDDDAEDDEFTDDDILEDDGYEDAENGLEVDTEDESEHSSSGTLSGNSSEVGSDLYDDQSIEDHSTDLSSPIDAGHVEAAEISSRTLRTPCLQKDDSQKLSSTAHVPVTWDVDEQKSGVMQEENSNSVVERTQEDNESTGDIPTSLSPMQKSDGQFFPSSIAKFTDKSSDKPMPTMRRPTRWGRTSARKNLSMESIDFSSDDEIAIQRLETSKNDLEMKITKEVEGNAILQASLEKRKDALHVRRLALEKDVEQLREHLQKERDLRESLESGLMNMRPGHLSTPSAMDAKTRADLEEITLAEADIINLKQKAADLRRQLSPYPQDSYSSLCESCGQNLYTRKGQQKTVNSNPLKPQLENSSKNDVGFSANVSENVQSHAQDLPPSSSRDPSQRTPQEPTSRTSSSEHSGSTSTASSISAAINLPNEFSTIDKTTISRADHEDVKAQNTDSLSSPNPHNQYIPRAHQENTMSPGSSSISHAEERSAVVKHAASDNSTCKDENAMSGVAIDNAEVPIQDSVPSKDRQPSRRLPSVEDPTTVIHDAPLKNSASRGEDRESGVGTKNVKAQTQDSLTLADRQPPQKLTPHATNQSIPKPVETDNASTSEETKKFGRNPASRRFSTKGKDLKKETQDSPSLPHRQQSLKQQPSNSNIDSAKTTGSSEGPPISGRNVASRKSFRSEESVSSSSSSSSSSSALTRLTNRLNFLKERRVQLVNELQNLDSTTSAPEPTSRTSSGQNLDSSHTSAPEPSPATTSRQNLDSSRASPLESSPKTTSK